VDRTSKFGALFLCLFALPFAGFGLFAFATAVRQMVNGTGDFKLWMLLIFGLVFTGIGLGLMSAVIFGGRILKQQQRAQAEHPAEPWLWRQDWAQGRIKGSTKSGMIGAWMFAALWNLISAPTLIFLPQAAAKKPIAYVGLIFPVAGMFLLIRAIRMTMAYVEFGTTWFEMSPVPGVVGGELRGTIQARFPHSPDHGVQLRISCVHRTTTGSGDHQNTSERIVWRGESSLASGQLYPGPNGTSIPVSFRIPWDGQSTETRSSRDVILWQLEAMADVPGVDYHDVFEVPVFRTAQTPAQPPPETAVTNAFAARPANLTVEVKQTAQGVEFYFPAARNKGFAAGTTVFLLIFGAVTYFLMGSRAPVIFPLAFGFFTLLLLYIVAQMWLGTTRVGISGSELLVQDGFLGGGKVRRFALSEIASITSAIKSQQGGGTGTPYYDIEMTLRGGKKVTLGRTIRNQQEVDWLMEEMRRLSGQQHQAAYAGGR
jgi:hypothetical protein